MQVVLYNNTKAFLIFLILGGGEGMNLARVSANGQITVPIEIRRKLHLKEGDKVLFIERENGDIVVNNASEAAINHAQRNFKGVAETMNVTDEHDVQELVDEIRYGGSKGCG